jgi:hypothetical protein
MHNQRAVLRNLPILELLPTLMGNILSVNVAISNNERQQSVNRVSTERQQSINRALTIIIIASCIS